MFTKEELLDLMLILEDKINDTGFLVEKYDEKSQVLYKSSYKWLRNHLKQLHNIYHKIEKMYEESA